MDIKINELAGQADVGSSTAQFFLNGPAGRIEARLMRASEKGNHNAVAVVCHPHPLYDGSLHNKVTYTLSRTLSQMGVPALRFNFRGVGESEGEYANGIGETEDLLAVIAEARRLYPNREVWLAGFSFGAYISLRVARKAEVSQLITVAPPVNFFEFQRIKAPQCPWLLIQGDADEVVPCEDVLEWAGNLQPGPQVKVLEGVGHFFHRRLNCLRDTVDEYFADSSQKERVAV